MKELSKKLLTQFFSMAMIIENNSFKNFKNESVYFRYSYNQIKTLYKL